MVTIEVVGVNGQTLLDPVTLHPSAIVEDVVALIKQAQQRQLFYMRLLCEDRCLPDHARIEELVDPHQGEKCLVLTAIIDTLSQDERTKFLSLVKERSPPCHLEDLFKSLPERARADEDVVKEFVKRDGRTFQHAHPSMFHSRAVVMEAVHTSRNALQFAHPDFREDREVILRATASFANGLDYADATLKSDPEFLVKAVRQCGVALAHVPQAFKSNPAIVKAAVQQNGMALEYVNSTMQQEHRDIVLEAVHQIGHALKHAVGSFHSDQEVVLAAVRNSGKDALKHVQSHLRQDPAVVQAASARPGWRR